jgi:hypothetical protein
VGKQVAHERLERCAQRAERAESDAELTRTQLSAMHALLHTNGEAHAEALAAELAHAHAEIARLSARSGIRRIHRHQVQPVPASRH